MTTPHHARRAAFSRRLGDAAALILSGREQTRSRTVTHPFRPDSDFYYLTGLSEPDAALLMRPTGGGHEAILFVRDRDPAREAWDGPRLGVEAAPAALGVDAARPAAELEGALGGLLEGVEALCYPLGHDPSIDRLVGAIMGPRGTGRGASLNTLTHPRATLHEQRVVKDALDLARMRQAAAATAEGFAEAASRLAPGMTERQVWAALAAGFLRGGASGPAYEPIVAGGDRATVLHAPVTDRVLAPGELVLIDAGAEVGCYASDVTRTWPVGGRFTVAQRGVYAIVLEAQAAGIAALTVGAPMDGFHLAAERVLAQGLIELGVLDGPLESAIAANAHKPYTRHHAGHFLGLDVHDVGAHRHAGLPRALEAGMVLTVEPGLYFPADDPAVPEALRGVGVRIEDDVLVTPDGPEVLTAAVPKAIAELEALLAR